MFRGLQGIRGGKICAFEEPAEEVRRKEHDERKQKKEYHCPDDVFDAVVRMKRNSVLGNAFGIFVLFDLNTVGIIGAHFVQCQNMRGDQPQQHQRDRNHVE